MQNSQGIEVNKFTIDKYIGSRYIELILKEDTTLHDNNEGLFYRMMKVKES